MIDIKDAEDIEGPEVDIWRRVDLALGRLLLRLGFRPACALRGCDPSAACC